MKNNEYALEIDVQAKCGEDEPRKAKVSGIAYSGGDIMQLMGRMVVDLSGMEFAPQIPLMNSHENSLAAKLGEVTPRIEGNKLVVDGEITSQSEAASAIIADGKLSCWQLSIGAGVNARHFVEAGKKCKVNGIEFEGPIFVADKTVLREVSVVAIGADKGASMTIAAALDMAELQVTSNEIQGESTMENKEPKMGTDNNESVTAVNVNAQIEAASKSAADEAVKAERQRIADISAVCNGEFNDIQAQAIAEGWDVNQCRAKVLEAIRAKAPAVGINITTPAKCVDQKAIEAAMCMREGVPEDILLKEYGEQVMDTADSIRGITLKDVVMESVKLSGGTCASSMGFSESDIRAGFSTTSLPGILSNVANKVMMKDFNAVAPAAYKLCSTGSLNDFKPSDRYRMTDLGQLELVPQNGEIKDTHMTEEHAVNQVDTYGKKFVLDRRMIYNDDMGAFTKIPKMMGAEAARLVDRLFFARLLANPTQEDSKALFHADHGNLRTGSPLTADNLKAAITLFENQTDAAGNPIACSPATLLVSTANKFIARELLNSANMITRGSTDAVIPQINVLANENLNIVSSPYMTNAADWYLFANPNEIDTFEIGFLRGKRTPTIQQGDLDFNTLGMWFRIYFDIGVREQDFRGVQKNVGA